MNGTEVLIDTNSLVDAQMKRLPENGLSFFTEAINENFTVSFITYIEFLGYKDATKANKDFIDLATIIEINRDIIDTCIDLRKTYRIKLPDAIIASTAFTKAIKKRLNKIILYLISPIAFPDKKLIFSHSLLRKFFYSQSCVKISLRNLGLILLLLLCPIQFQSFAKLFPISSSLLLRYNHESILCFSLNFQ